MINLQEIIVWLLFVVCILAVSYWIYNMIAKSKEGKSSCGSCSSKCSMKDFDKSKECKGEN